MNLPVRRRLGIDRLPRLDDGTEVLFLIADRHGDDAALWGAAHREHPDAVIHIVHRGDPNLHRRDGRLYFRDVELEMFASVTA